MPKDFILYALFGGHNYLIQVFFFSTKTSFKRFKSLVTIFNILYLKAK